MSFFLLQDMTPWRHRRRFFFSVALRCGNRRRRSESARCSIETGFLQLLAVALVFGIGNGQQRQALERKTFRIGGTLSLSGRNEAIGRSMNEGLNAVKSMLRNGKTFETEEDEIVDVEFDIQDDESEATKVEELYKQMNDTNLHNAYLAPYSTSATVDAAKALAPSRVLMVSNVEEPIRKRLEATDSGDSSVKYDSVFSTSFHAIDHFRASLSMLQKSGAESVYVLCPPQDSGYVDKLCCDRAVGAVNESWKEDKWTTGSTTDFVSAVRDIRLTRTDVVVMCGNLFQEIMFTISAQSLVLTAKAVLMTHGTSREFLEAVGAPSANYFMSAAVWDETMEISNTTDPVLFDSSADFASKFNQAAANLTTEAASYVVSILSLISALAKVPMDKTAVGPDNDAAIASVLKSLTINTFIGTVRFDDDGERDRWDMINMTLQYKPQTLSDSHEEQNALRKVIIYEGGDEGIAYPMPSAAQRELDVYPCKIGLERRKGDCENCSIGRFRDSSMVHCLPCPNGMYNEKPGSAKCKICQRGINCTGENTGEQKALHGYYAFPPAGKVSVLECSKLYGVRVKERNSPCLEGNACANDSTGVLCRQCRKGYYNTGSELQSRVSENLCYQCGGGGGLIFFRFILMIFFYTLLVLVLLRATLASADSPTALYCPISRTVLNAFVLLAVGRIVETDIKTTYRLTTRMELARVAYCLVGIMLKPYDFFVQIECIAQDLNVEIHKALIFCGLITIPFWILFSTIPAAVCLPIEYEAHRQQRWRVTNRQRDQSVARVTTTTFDVEESDTVATDVEDDDASNSTRNLQSLDKLNATNALSSMAENEGYMTIHGLIVSDGVVLAKQFPSLREHFMERWTQIVVIFVFLFYPITLVTLMDGSVCAQIDIRRLQRNLDVSCETQDFKTWNILAVLGLVVYGLGVPVAFVIRLCPVRRELHLLSVQRKCGFLYNGFHASCFFFEALHMLRNGAACLLVHEIDPFVRSLTLLIVGTLSYLCHVLVGPLDKRDFGVLERLEGLNLFAFTTESGWRSFMLVCDGILSSQDDTSMSDADADDLFMMYAEFFYLAVFLISYFVFFLSVFKALVNCFLVRRWMFLFECVPQDLTSAAWFVFDRIGLQRRIMSMDKDTLELDISRLGKQERHFLAGALSETLRCYIEADKELQKSRHSEADGDATSKPLEECRSTLQRRRDLTQSNRQAPAYADGTFYLGYLNTAVKIAVQNIHASRALRFESMASGSVSSASDRYKSGRRNKDEQRTPTQFDRGDSANAFESVLDAGFMKEVLSNPTLKASGAFLVEDLHLALMQIWPKILASEPAFFVEISDLQRSRPRAVGEKLSWGVNSDVQDILQDLRARQGSLKRHDAHEDDEVTGNVDINEVVAADGGTLGDMLGMRDAAEFASEKHALSKAHSDLMIQVVEMRNEKAKLEKLLKAAGHTIPVRPAYRPEEDNDPLGTGRSSPIVPSDSGFSQDDPQQSASVLESSVLGKSMELRSDGPRNRSRAAGQDDDTT